MEILAHSLLLLFLFTSATCCGISMPYGNITEDLDLEVGSALTVRCNIFSSKITYENNTFDVTSKDLILKFGSDIVDSDIFSNSTIEYSVEKATINDSGPYSCYVKLPSIEKSLLICSTTVSVGYKPLAIQHFSCISYEFTNLTCSWVKPFNPVQTDYKLWDYLRVEAFKRQCPEPLNETSCRWTMYTTPQYYRSTPTLYFLMIGTNSLGESKQRISEDHYKIVKPGVPRKVMFTNVTTTSLVIQWLAPDKMEYGFPPGLQYSIQYQAILPPNPKVFEKFEAEDTKLMVEDLIPHTLYKFTVRCRSTAVDNDDYWSSVVNVTEETEEDVPYLAPEVSESSFEVENILGNRTITLYWKAIPVEFENGDNFHYVIQYHIHHVPSRIIRSNHEIRVGKTTVYSIPHLDVHSAYLFKLYAVNKMGSSYNATAIVVDKSEKLLEKPKDIIVVSYGQGKYNLSWKASNQRPYNFTIYWCKTPNPRPYKCEGPMEWMHTTKSKVVIDLPEKEANFQFAVAANDDGQSSGLAWASCLVYYKGVNYKVKRVELTPKTATSLKVQWSLECEAQKIVFKEYAIQYCAYAGSCSRTYDTKSCSVWKTVNVSNVSKDEFILGSLKPFTQYLVFMRVHTVSGWSGNSNLACEMTMPTAPSDPPGNVKVTNIQGKTISISFEPPKVPNGIITRYLTYYNRSDGVSHHQEFRELPHMKETYTVDLVDSVLFYTNYSIEVMACVNQACSQKSTAVYAFTDIAAPDAMRFPRVEVIDNYVNVSWENPVFPNGPLDYFQVMKESNESSSIQVFNVTSGKNYKLIKHNCSENEEDKAVYHFRVRAVNIRNGEHLLGPYSQQTKTTLCNNGTPVGVIVGIAVGATVGAIVVLLVVYSIYCWMRNELDMIKGITVQLPKDLDCPMENPLSSYDKFKNGLQTNHDSGIPADTSYERLCAFASEDVKELGRVMEEANQKTKRKSSGRNNSGESNISGKCHDSISSSNTTKTHLSIDSGAEVDSPPSPDALFSDTSSTHTTPRSYKPDLTIVQEGNSCNSKDSGLDKEGNCSFNNQNVDLPSKFSYFVKMKNLPYTNVQIPDSRMPSYSKFAVLTATNTPSFIPYGEQNLGILENSLSNSEPSVAEFDVEGSSEPLVPYCKFGLARSAGNGLNGSNQPVIVNSSNIGYSKFGTVYRALKRIDSGNIPILNPGIHPVPKFLPHSPQTFTALTAHKILPGKHLPLKENDKAYSKFGVSSKKPQVNGYVSFRDTLTYPSAESPGANQAYSKVGMGAPNEPKVNGVIINPAELPSLSSRTSYVPFRNARDMNVNDSHGIINDSINRDTLNDSFNKDCCSLNESSSSSDSPNKERKSFITPESEQLAPANQNALPELKDNILDGDIDCVVINDPSSSLLDEISSDLGNKLNPTNFMISANNDSKGFLIHDESANQEPVNQLTNIMDALFGTFDFSGSDNSGIEPIIINLDDLDGSHPCNNDEDRPSDFTVESRNFCKQCNNEMSECSCSSVGKISQVGVMCNGHSSPLGSDYVPISCNSSC